MKVEKVDILRDSLDSNNDSIASSAINDELLDKVKAGTLPQSAFCIVGKTGELIDLEFDYKLAKCYINPITKDYYKPISQ